METPATSTPTVMARTNLDGMVVNLELTLISIIQGVALYFLADSSRGLLVSPQVPFLPYVLSGLFIILLWWSRAVMHTLTVIRWPIEFLHNFIYVASTLVEAAMFTQVNNPANWFALGVAYTTLLWVLFATDLHLIHRRMSESTGSETRSLLNTLYREQGFHARFSMPLTVLYYLVAAIVIRVAPSFFIDQHGHVLLAILQLLGAVSYVIYIVVFFRRLSGRILAMRAENV